MSGAVAGRGRLRAALGHQLERWLPALLRRRHDEPLPIRLHRRRLYVLPTGFGLFAALVFFVMQLGALNYNNNPALLFTFMLGAACFVSVFRGFRNINGLSLEALRALPCHAGDVLELTLHARCRPGQGQRIRLEHLDARVQADADDSGALTWTLKLPTTRRGWLHPGDLALSTRWPLGLFQIWSWLRPDWRALVYPAAERQPPPLPQAGRQAAARTARSGDEDLRMLRPYQPGDGLGRVAWKASARSADLIVRELERPEGQDVVLDWHALAGLGYEQRIARLTAWVLEAQRVGLRWTLQLPDARLGPDLGQAHAARCLRALALLPEAG